MRKELFTEEELKIIEEAKKIYPEYKYQGKSPSNFKDLTGMKFGYLKVLYRGENQGKWIAGWVCLCQCGKILNVRGCNLTSENSKSCGCYNSEQNSIRGKKYNQYNLTDYDFGVGWTSKGEPFYFDKEDYDLIKDYCWYKSKKRTIETRSKNGKLVKMHRLIMGVLDDPTIIIDHIYHNPDGSGREYDNRKENLRKASQISNQYNKKVQTNNKFGCKGIRFDQTKKRYITTIRYQKKLHYLGSFKTLDEAIIARKEAEEKYYGEFQYKVCDVEVPPLN